MSRGRYFFEGIAADMDHPGGASARYHRGKWGLNEVEGDPCPAADRHRLLPSFFGPEKRSISLRCDSKIPEWRGQIRIGGATD